MRVRQGDDIFLILFVTVIAFLFLCVSLATPWYFPAFISVPKSDCTVTVKQFWQHIIYDCATEHCRRVGYNRNDFPCGDTEENWRDTCTPNYGSNRLDAHYQESVQGRTPCTTDAQSGVWNVTFAMVILASVFSLFNVIFSLVRYAKSGSHLWGGWKPQFWLFFLTALVSLIAILVFSVGLPNAIEDDVGCPRETGPCYHFVGEMRLVDESTGALLALYKWGPGPGWVLCVVNFLWLFIGMLLCFLSIPLYPKIEAKPGQKNPADTGEVAEIEVGNDDEKENE